jgi:hypothetical protein
MIGILCPMKRHITMSIDKAGVDRIVRVLLLSQYGVVEFFEKHIYYHLYGSVIEKPFIVQEREAVAGLVNFTAFASRSL